MPENKKQTQEDKADEVLENGESELEEKIEQNEETENLIDDNQFYEFIKPSDEPVSPVLEKVETLEQESLEQEIDSVPIQTENREKDSIKYSQASDYSEENKMKYQGNIEPSVLHPANVQDNSLRQEFLQTPREIDFSKQGNIRSEPIHPGFVERRQKLPFESDSKKYKEVKL